MHPTEALNAALTGRYAIDRRVGEGGMATVYLARDLRHNRKVALKVLKPDLGAVVGADRFLSEIEVTANLQHPNLLPLFDSGSAEGLLYYVMPFVEGESLRARLEREKQLPIDEAVRIASAVAGALDYAHARGVIHRDLKPENILLQHGQPVVADFGIALAVRNAAGNRITQTGLSLGTPRYMSPEQAAGDRQIDARTDVYSLGAVTYEMLTGDPPHVGSSSQAVIARLLTEKPRPIRTARPNVPAYVAAAVERALEKLPADRFASAHELADALTGVRPITIDERSTPSTSHVAAPAAKIVRLAPWAVAVAAVALAGWALRPRASPLVPLRLQVEIPDSVDVRAPTGTTLALSRDGTQLVFVGRSDSSLGARRVFVGGSRILYLRRLADPAALPILGTEGASSPRFSPDGRMLVFVAGTRAADGRGLSLRTVPVAGGTPREIARDVAGSVSWGDDDQILFTSARGLEAVSSEGGERRVVSPGSPTRIILWVETLPGGRDALVTYATSAIISAQTNRLAVVSIADGGFADLGLQGTIASYAAPGYVVFARGAGETFAAPFSLVRRKVTGAPVLLVQGQLAVGMAGASHAVSQNGTLAYVGSTATAGATAATDLVIVDPHGAVRQLTREPAQYSHPRVSPDGRRVAIDVGAGRATGVGGRIYVYDVAAGTSTLVSTDSNSSRPEWTRDGSRILYRQTLTDSVLVWSRPWNLSTPPAVVARGGDQSFYEVALGPPGALAAIRHGTAGPGAIVPTRIVLAPSESLGVARPLFDRVASIAGLSVSPNGKLLAYASNESRRAEVYVTPIPGPGPRVQVSVNGGAEPVWSRDGKVLYFRSPVADVTGPVMAAAIVTEPALAVTRRDSLFADVFARAQTQSNYDVFPDRRFLMLRARAPSGAERDRLFVIVNWPQLIEKRGARTAR